MCKEKQLLLQVMVRAVRIMLDILALVKSYSLHHFALQQVSDVLLWSEVHRCVIYTEFECTCTSVY